MLLLSWCSFDFNFILLPNFSFKSFPQTHKLFLCFCQATNLIGFVWASGWKFTNYMLIKATIFSKNTEQKNRIFYLFCGIFLKDCKQKRNWAQKFVFIFSIHKMPTNQSINFSSVFSVLVFHSLWSMGQKKKEIIFILFPSKFVKPRE